MVLGNCFQFSPSRCGKIVHLCYLWFTHGSTCSGWWNVSGSDIYYFRAEASRIRLRFTVFSLLLSCTGNCGSTEMLLAWVPALISMSPLKLVFIFNPQTHMQMLFGGGAFGKKSGFDEIMRVGPQHGICDFIRERREIQTDMLLWSLHMWCPLLCYEAAGRPLQMQQSHLWTSQFLALNF